MATTYLDRILAHHRERAGRDSTLWGELARKVAQLPPTRDFAGAVRGRAGVSVIAEIKRRSPSRGELAPGLDPAGMARRYARGGAAALSVLTDAEFFGGSPGDLAAARDAVPLPVLRKDFTVSMGDVYESRLMGADAILLIVAALGQDELVEYLGCAGEIGLAALVEVHDEVEAERALGAGACLIGVNQRDLTTFEVDTARADRVAQCLPPDVARVAESGISSPQDVSRLARTGFDAVLVGEALVVSDAPEEAVRCLVDAGAGETAGR